MYLAISVLKSNNNSNYILQDEWYYFRRHNQSRLRLVGDKDAIAQLMAGQPCDAFKISGFYNYNTGLLRVGKLELAKNDILWASCSY